MFSCFGDFLKSISFNLARMAGPEMATMCNWWESMTKAVLSINARSAGQIHPELNRQEKGLAPLTFSEHQRRVF